MAIKIILVSRKGEPEKAYLSELKKIGIKADVVSSFKELFKSMLVTPYNGVLVDLMIRISAPREDKILVHEVLETFPVITMRWDSKTGVMRTFYYGQFKSDSTLEDFINRECRFFRARTIRSSVRRNIHLNIMMSKNGDFIEENIIKTITLNISGGGCFLYNSEDMDDVTNAWIIIKELSDKKPIYCEIRWVHKWGEIMRIPGIGLKFLDISESQLQELSEKYNIDLLQV